MDTLIGIDPSLSHCGAAIWRPGTKELVLASGDIFEVMAFLNSRGCLTTGIVVLEDPNLSSNFYGGFGMVKAEVLKYGRMQGSLGEVESAFRMAAKQAQNVGENKAAAKVIARLFERAGVPVGRVSPADRHRADKDLRKPGLAAMGIAALVMPTKTTSEQFQQLTGYTGRTNEHARDAGTLVYGRSIIWAKNLLARNPQ